MRLLLTLLWLTAVAFAGLNKDQLAEITFHDQSNKLHTRHLQYFIDGQRLQYGVKFAITLHRVEIVDCKPDFKGLTEEYFAAYIVIPTGCNALEVIKQSETHGANFIFIDAHKASNSRSKLQSNGYQVPVFFLDSSEDLFLLEATGTASQFLSLFFLMVRSSAFRPRQQPVQLRQS